VRLLVYWSSLLLATAFAAVCYSTDVQATTLIERPDISIHIRVSKPGKLLAVVSKSSGFGKTLSVSKPGVMKVEVLADALQSGSVESNIHVRIYLQKRKTLSLIKEEQGQLPLVNADTNPCHVRYLEFPHA
jgi:hypothetical protein